MVGLDAGVAKLATLSDGTVFEPVNSFQKNQKTLARLQRQLSRKVKFSNNWQKQKRKIQRLHSCIAGLPSQSHNGRQQKPRNDSH
ncbi:hypothetical protein DLU39_19920 [Shigella boydii]|nr:hypothetical protein [Shigella boydii]